MVVASTSLALTRAVSRASSSSRMPRSWASRRDLDLDLGHELALGFLGGQPGDGLELSLVLVQRIGQPRFRLGEATLAVPQALLAILKVMIPPVEELHPAAELLFLLGHPALELLDFLLPGAGFLLQLGPGAQGALLDLELGSANLGLGLARLGLRVAGSLVHVALGVLHDATGARLGIADGADGGDLLTQVSDQEGEDCDEGQEQQHQHPSVSPSGETPDGLYILRDTRGK